MGKNSLIKSTTQKKKTEKKKTAPKKTKAAAAKEAKPKVTRKAKGTVTQKTDAAKSKKAPAKAKAPKQTRKKAKAPSVKTLLFKKFDQWEPEKPFVPPVTKDTQDYAAPPFFTQKDPKETKRLKALLFKTFDLKEAPPRTRKEPEKTPPPEKQETAPASPGAKRSKEPLRPAEPDTKSVEEAAKPEKESVKAEAIPEPSPVPGKKPEAEAKMHLPPPVPPQEPASPDRATKFVVAGFVLLMGILIAVSALNSKNYTIKAADNGIEIWKGSFAPMGEKRFLALPGMEVPRPLKSRYSKEEAFSLAFGYFLDKADALSKGPGMPDFKKIRKTLERAVSFAVTESQKAMINKRLAHIDFMVLLYKTDVTLAKGTIQSADEAMGYIKEAGALQLDRNQRKMLEERRIAARKLVTDLKAKSHKAMKSAKKPAREKK